MIFPRRCPFCGKQPEVQPKDPKTQGNAWGAVECMNMQCPARPRVEDTAVQNDERGSRAYQRLAITVWNRSLRRFA